MRRSPSTLLELKVRQIDMRPGQAGESSSRRRSPCFHCKARASLWQSTGNAKSQNHFGISHLWLLSDEVTQGLGIFTFVPSHTRSRDMHRAPLNVKHHKHPSLRRFVVPSLHASSGKELIEIQESPPSAFRKHPSAACTHSISGRPLAWTMNPAPA